MEVMGTHQVIKLFLGCANEGVDGVVEGELELRDGGPNIMGYSKHHHQHTIVSSPPLQITWLAASLDNLHNRYFL